MPQLLVTHSLPCVATVDMILAGDDHNNVLLTVPEAQTQLSIWSIMASPLIMSSDLRTVNKTYRDVLLNKEMIRVSQDPMGKAGVRVSPKGDTEVWARELQGGDAAIALLNKADGSGGGGGIDNCGWNYSQGSYIEACGGLSGNDFCGQLPSVEDFKKKCCGDLKCKGFSHQSNGPRNGYGCTKNDNKCGIKKGADGDQKTSQGPQPTPSPTPPGATLSVNLGMAGLPLRPHTTYTVHDIWAGKDLGSVSTSDNLTAAVPLHGTSLFRLSAQKAPGA